MQKSSNLHLERSIQLRLHKKVELRCDGAKRAERDQDKWVRVL